MPRNKAFTRYLPLSATPFPPLDPANRFSPKLVAPALNWCPGVEPSERKTERSG